MSYYTLELGQGDRGEHRLFRGVKLKADRLGGAGPFFEEEFFEGGVDGGLLY